MFKILVVEDQLEISDIVVKYLKNSGYDYDLAKNGFEALEYFSKNTYHLMLLDVMMPGIDGFEVLIRIREVSDIPVIMLTAKEEEVDRIKGFEKGADDYVIKPFSPRELMGRIKVFLKRIYQGTEEIVLSEGDLKLFTNSMKAQKSGQDLDLTATEFKIVHTLMRNKGTILTREQLIEQSFGQGYDGFDRNIDSYIKRIRQKIESDPKKPTLLITKYGVGYVFGGEK
ncbi:MAG: response regulator transcription factor [Proteocatella sp.]